MEKVRAFDGISYLSIPSATNLYEANARNPANFMACIQMVIVELVCTWHGLVPVDQPLALVLQPLQTAATLTQPRLSRDQVRPKHTIIHKILCAMHIKQLA